MASPSNLYIRDLCNQLHKLDLSEPSITDIKHTIQQKCSIPIHHQQLWHNGKHISNHTQLSTITLNNAYTEISLSLSLHGGKGGFGSMLRAAGKLNKTTNKSAMRDLSGRRYRFVEQEKEMREWINEQKSNKPMTESEIQSDFKHIKQFGTLPEKRMCHRGVNCRIRDRCKFRHPNDTNNAHNKNKHKKPKFKALDMQTNEEIRNALLMGKINAKQSQKLENENKTKIKEMIPLFGTDEDMSANVTEISNKPNTESNNETLHGSHRHKLQRIMREDCDFVICDICLKQYKGPSWNCPIKGCDFDLCDDCVRVECDMDLDRHLREYNKESTAMKEIQQRDADRMNIKAFSSNVNRKRKRKERKLGLLGLENKSKKNCAKLKSDNVCESNKEEMTGVSTCVNVMKGEIDLNDIKDINGVKVFGLDTLKSELQLYGLKCGGTLQQRAERFLLLKDTKLEDLPKNCFVSKRKKYKKPPMKKRKIAE